VHDIAHEGSIDLEVIDIQVLQVRERTQPGTEIVERKLAAQFPNVFDEQRRLIEVCNRRRFGDLETDPVTIEFVFFQLVFDIAGQGVGIVQ
jgi:hypothetical protein